MAVTRLDNKFLPATKPSSRMPSRKAAGGPVHFSIGGSTKPGEPIQNQPIL